MKRRYAITYILPNGTENRTEVDAKTITDAIRTVGRFENMATANIRFTEVIETFWERG